LSSSKFKQFKVSGLLPHELSIFRGLDRYDWKTADFREISAVASVIGQFIYTQSIPISDFIEWYYIVRMERGGTDMANETKSSELHELLSDWGYPPTGFFQSTCRRNKNLSSKLLWIGR